MSRKMPCFSRLPNYPYVFGNQRHRVRSQLVRRIERCDHPILIGYDPRSGW
jgi:hypothetical protein